MKKGLKLSLLTAAAALSVGAVAGAVKNEVKDACVSAEVEQATLEDLIETALGEFKEYRDSFNEADYYARELAMFYAAYDQGVEAISKAESSAEIDTAVYNAKQALDAVKTAQEVAGEVFNAVADAKVELKDFVDPADYNADEKVEITNILEKAQEEFDAATTLEEVDEIVVATKAKILKVATSEELYDAQLAVYKTTMIEFIGSLSEEKEGNYVTASDEFEMQVALAMARVAAAKTNEEVDAVVAAFVAYINAGTDSDAKILEDAKNAYCDAIDSIKNQLLANYTYRLEQVSTIENLAAAGKKVIRQQTTVAKVQSQYTAVVQMMTQVQTDAEMTQAELNAAIANAVADIESYLDYCNFNVNGDDFKEAVRKGVEAVKAAATIAEVAEAYKEAKAAIYAVRNDSEAAEAAANVDALIVAIGEVEYNLAVEARIAAAVEALAGLTENEKALCTKLLDLEAARADFELYKEADVAIKAIENIGEVEYRVLCKARIDDAREAYDSLSAAAKNKVSEETLTILLDAEETYAALKEEANKVGCAGSVVAASGIVTLTTLLGAGLLASKKKEN